MTETISASTVQVGAFYLTDGEGSQDGNIGVDA